MELKSDPKMKVAEQQIQISDDPEPVFIIQKKKGKKKKKDDAASSITKNIKEEKDIME